MLGFLCMAVSATAQTNLFTFTTESGVTYTNAKLILIEKDGVLLGFTNWQYKRVKFTNMSLALQKQFGHDPDKIRKEIEERQAAEKAAQERAIADAKAAQYDSIKEFKDTFSLYTFDESAFPKTDAARQACKEILLDLKGVSTALDLGCSFNKFSDLLTDKVLSVEQIKELRGEGIPAVFLRHVDDCVDAYKESKHWWNEKIEADRPHVEALDEYFMRDYWSEADLELICCAGIAESNTNAISDAIDKMAERIKDRQDAVAEGTLEDKGNYDPNVYGLSADQISAKLRESMSATNAPTNSEGGTESTNSTAP